MAEETITLTTPVKVKYKRRKHPRIFRIWDSSLLNTAMIQASDIKSNIEKISIEQKQTLAEMKPALLPTSILYHLANSYLILYEAQMKEGLIQTGSPKIQPTLH